jgi:hypothetical protein
MPTSSAVDRREFVRAAAVGAAAVGGLVLVAAGAMAACLLAGDAADVTEDILFFLGC